MDSDSEDEIADLCQLTTVKEPEEPQPSTSGSRSQYSVSESEADIAALCQLTSVKEAEEPQPSTSGSRSQYSIRGLCNTSSNVQQECLKIQAAISLNKLVDEKLKNLQDLLTLKLRECRQQLNNFHSSPDTPTKSTDKSFKYFHCGKPYFKDPANFAAPDNEDTVLMAKSHMYDYTSITSVPGWTLKEKSELITILHKMSVDLKKNELNSNISQLQQESNNTKKTAKTDNNREKHIAAIRKEICDLHKKPLGDLALPIHMEYDWDMVANKSKCRHSPQECRALWRLFLHPLINKNSWNNTEHENLKKIAHANEFQDWDKIAEELGTGRTGYQCFVYFRTNMRNTFTGQKWSNEEEEYLKTIIEYYREGDYIPWGKISSFMENRTKIQIYNKYLRLMEQRKGRFLPEEDAVILTCVKKFGPNFRRVMKYLPGRSMAQLRARYNVLFTGNGRKTSIVWTADEDKKLIQFMANQDSILNYSSLTKHFPGKDRGNLRARYTTLVKWMRKHPNVDISKAPRRGARRLVHGVASQDLNNAVEKLTNRMQLKVENKKSTKLSKYSTHEEVDAAIVAALINEKNKAEEEEKSKTSDMEQSVLKEYWGVTSTPPNITNLQKALILLKAKLDKTKFLNSPVSQVFPELLQDSQETCVQVKKTYSRNTRMEVLNQDQPDIWGNKTLESTEYVLPPNYSTITACRKLLDYSNTSSEDKQPIELSSLAKRNVVLKDQLDLFMDRCKVLFMWPMLLSNESPPTRPVQEGMKMEPPPVKTSVLLGDPGIAIPVTPCTPFINENIDLSESTKKEEDVTVKDIYVGNDDPLYKEH